MGLDMYVWKVSSQEATTTQIDFDMGTLLDDEYEQMRAVKGKEEPSRVIVAGPGGVLPTNQTFNPDAWQQTRAQREVWYWRKHPDLHGWMQRLYAKKGGDPDPEAFDGFGATVRLDAEDLENLHHDMLADVLPHTTGFFFGESRPEDRVETLKFLDEARKLVREGWVLFYGSSW